MPYDTVVISGPDGSGKSTISKILKGELMRRGYPVYYVWLRYPRLLSLLPLLVSKLIKTTTKIEVKGVCKHIFHDYRRIPILGRLYEVTILVDYLIYKLLKVVLPRFIGYMVVIDRDLLDIIVDVYIETKRFPKILYKALILESKRINSLRILVVASRKTLVLRRRDNLCNPGFREIPTIYKVLGSKCGYRIVLNETPEDLKNILIQILLNFNSVRVYADPRHSIIRALFHRHKWLIPLSNVVFQCMNYMWRVELAFRGILQLFLVTILILTINLHLVLALVSSHLLLYPLFSNPLAIQKWLWNKRKVVTIELVKFLLRLANIRHKQGRCVDIYIVGSLARNPCKLLKEGGDIDIRLVPGPSTRCVILSLITAPYVRLWSLLHGIPVDLYVKPPNTPELKNSKNLTEFVNLMNSCKELQKS